MNIYDKYLEEIKQRKTQGLHPKPIDNSELLDQIIKQIIDANHIHRKESLNFFIYNVIPGTTSAAFVKAKFLKDIILKKYSIKEISVPFAFELLSHMKGGPSVKVLLDIALSDDQTIAKEAAEILKTQVFLYEADTNRLKKAYQEGNLIALSIIESYSKAEFFTNLPDINEEIKVVTYVAGDIVKVHCETKTLPKGDVEKIDDYIFDSNDSAIIIAEFKCGALGSLNISRWGTGHKRRIRLNIFGDNGALEIETEKSEDQINLCLDNDVINAQFISTNCPSVPNIYQLFVKGISDNVQPKPSFIEGHNVTKILESCYLSSKRNETVEIN